MIITKSGVTNNMGIRMISDLKTPNVYVATQCFPNTDTAPIVTVFNNKEAADQYAKYVVENGQAPACCVDKCPVHHTVTITK